MKWKVVGATAIGSSHKENNTLCQDFISYQEFPDKNEDITYVLICCDGSGSAQYSDLGALGCIQTMNANISKYLKNSEITKIQDSDIQLWCIQANTFLNEIAHQVNHDVEDYATTMLVVIVKNSTCIVFQIGDGVIVLGSKDKTSHEFIVSQWPDKASYANETHFITDDDATLHIETTRTSIVDRIAIFSDGLQRIALDEKNRKAHSPFFTPLFNGLKNIKEKDIHLFENELKKYLNSAIFDEKTDDDRSLMLATLT